MPDYSHIEGPVGFQRINLLQAALANDPDRAFALRVADRLDSWTVDSEVEELIDIINLCVERYVVDWAPGQHNEFDESLRKMGETTSGRNALAFLSHEIAEAIRGQRAHPLWDTYGADGSNYDAKPSTRVPGSSDVTVPRDRACRQTTDEIFGPMGPVGFSYLENAANVLRGTEREKYAGWLEEKEASRPTSWIVAEHFRAHPSKDFSYKDFLNALAMFHSKEFPEGAGILQAVRERFAAALRQPSSDLTFRGEAYDSEGHYDVNIVGDSIVVTVPHNRDCPSDRLPQKPASNL